MHYYRRLQRAVREARPEFNPEGLDEWLAAQDRRFISEARDIVADLEAFLKSDVRQRLEDEFGSNCERSGVPRRIRKEIAESAIAKNLDASPANEVEPWDCLYLIDYRDILTQDHGLWTRRFAKRYTRPGDEQLKGTWKLRADWLKELNRIRNDTAHSRGISEADFAFLTEIRSWLTLGEIDNEL